MPDRQKRRILRPVEILVVVVLLIIVAVITGGSHKSRVDARRVGCQNNLSVIANAMQTYANDYDGAFPHSGGRNAVWSMMIPNWNATNKFQAFGMAANGEGGVGTISSCFYLLVKHAGVAPNFFVCPGEEGTTEFRFGRAGGSDKTLADLWDFGLAPSSHCSYSYHSPFGLYSLTTSSESGLALAADRNPWVTESQATQMSLFRPDGGSEAAKMGNSAAHDKEGQNVLFVDGHVKFEEFAFCGINNDNIYTLWDGGDIRLGIKPFTGAEPQDARDSLLVNEPALRRTEITRETERVDTNDLKQTVVLATLDCPVPDHKNAVWCAPFQMAWDKFKNDIIGEPIQLIGESDLPERLDRSEYSHGNIEAESLYTAAGFVKDGILEEIQEEMARRFPSEPEPEFNELYRQLPGASIAYAFLKLDVGFKYPFYTNNNKFIFNSSIGTRDSVTSFSTYTELPDPDSRSVVEQVEILYYRDKFGGRGEIPEFAVDLCRHTKPYQVVLARVPRQQTLSQTLEDAQKKVREFQENPEYENMTKLSPMDKLIVPDVFFNLMHHFKELEEDLANPKWRKLGYFIFEAQQMIEFSLSRKGVSLKSEARLGGGGGLPRILSFDRPFLIYVKKRGDEHSPFFVMWVDNAELMQEFSSSTGQ